MLLLQILTILGCGVITYQDFRDRMVTWTLFPTVALLLFAMHLHRSDWEPLLLFSLINCMMVTAVLLILFLYSKLVLRKRFLDVSLGTGDVLFFYALALGFPTFTFVLLFTGAIFFSLMAFLIIKIGGPVKTVPLAGLMGLFLIGVLIVSLFRVTPSLYII